VFNEQYLVSWAITEEMFSSQDFESLVSPTHLFMKPRIGFSGAYIYVVRTC